MVVLIGLILLGWIVCIVLCAVLRYGHQIAMFFMAIIPYVLWVIFWHDDPNYVSIFSMERTLISQLSQTSDSYIQVWVTVMMFVFIYILIIAFSKISKWSMAAAYGCVASVGFSSLIEFIDVLEPTNQFPRAIVFIVSLIITILFMHSGFHSVDLWIMPDRKIFGLIMGIIPAFICMFITWCNIFTATFGVAVKGKMLFVILAFVLDVVMLGVGIFLYLKYNYRYWRIMMKKLGVVEDTCVMEHREIIINTDQSESRTEERSEKKASKKTMDMSLNADVMEMIRKKNSKKNNR